ncbi:MAG: 30S ribosomal protein S18 [Lentisphaeraceae bacterium]|nr:30S ribosomal protein S18 [Lentisphaeraceae bacterium]
MAFNKKKKRRKKTVRVKSCRFTEQNVNYVDFKDSDLLRKFQTEGGRILPRRITGTSKKHQAMLAAAIKKARNIALVK